MVTTSLTRIYLLPSQSTFCFCYIYAYYNVCLMNEWSPIANEQNIIYVHPCITHYRDARDDM